MRSLIEVEIRDKDGHTLLKIWSRELGVVVPEEWEIAFKFKQFGEGDFGEGDSS